MRVACVGYRDWALNIYERLSKSTDNNILIIRSKSQLSEGLIRDFRPDLILFYGWSWLVPASIINSYTCLMLHPSPLPLYRGGSPIQNQIIAGEVDSKVTIFVMNEQLDAGDIVAQEYLSLAGTLNQIFSRIEDIGYRLSLTLFEGALNRYPQNHKKATIYPRRDASDSEITLHELESSTAEYLYNKIRMLADPYPNAYIKTVDGRRLLIKCAEIAEDI
jgi:methionyl-tRNA formyltransferase